jgi:hypothetical protein
MRNYGPVAQADQFYPSWAADGNLYSPYADGTVLGVRVICTTHPGHMYVRQLGISDRSWHQEGEFIRSEEGTTSTGNAVIRGDDPFDLAFEGLASWSCTSARWHGYYPCGSLVHKGVWYYGRTYYHRWLDENDVQHEYELGPCGGFRISEDFGQTWKESPLDDRSPLFPECGRPAGGAPIRLGVPKFVDFGKDSEHSPDALAYLVGHGTQDPNGIANWSSGDAIFLARVPPSPENINDPEAYEYFAGVDASGRPQWSADFSKIQPIIEWAGHCGLVTMTYHPWLRKYFCLITVGYPDGSWGPFDAWVAEADEVWGSWSRVDYWRFDNMVYCISLPSKFIEQNSNRAAIFYNPYWGTGQCPSTNPVRSRLVQLDDETRYALHVAEIEFVVE